MTTYRSTSPSVQPAEKMTYPNRSSLSNGCPTAGREHRLAREGDRLVCIYCARHKYLYGGWDNAVPEVETVISQVWS